MGIEYQTITGKLKKPFDLNYKPEQANNVITDLVERIEEYGKEKGRVIEKEYTWGMSTGGKKRLIRAEGESDVRCL